MADGEYYRGGNSLTPNVKEVRTDRKTGLVLPRRGVSVRRTPDGLERFGGPYRVTNVPPDLEVRQIGADPDHYEIVPVRPMTFAEYEELLGRIVLDPVTRWEPPMADPANAYTVHFPADYGARDEFEMPSRGYFNGVVVELADGTRHPVSFIDPARLAYEAGADFANGGTYFAEPNMVVLPRVTPAAIRAAIADMVQGHFFQELKAHDPAVAG
jgi:hypothetical protein